MYSLFLEKPYFAYTYAKLTEKIGLKLPSLLSHLQGRKGEWVCTKHTY